MDASPPRPPAAVHEGLAVPLAGPGAAVTAIARDAVILARRLDIAPTDPVDLLEPNAVWQPSYLGFGGQCGSTTALWVQELMPVGWGDTYFQSIAGQSFNITGVPNGTYYIQVAANPLKVLHESDTSNNVSLRKDILGGKPGHRTVRVPAVNGIDPEG
jgi:hypothetical protein